MRGIGFAIIAQVLASSDFMLHVRSGTVDFIDMVVIALLLASLIHTILGI